VPLFDRRSFFALTCAAGITTACAPLADAGAPSAPSAPSAIGRYQVSTIPLEKDIVPVSATYTPSGKVLLSYRKPGETDRRKVSLAVMDDDGGNMRAIFSQVLPVREKDNGIRYMVFDDNRRIFLGDFIIECAPSIDACDKAALLPVEYPPEVASGDHVSHRWSEIVVAPDNRHIAWTTLLSNYSALVFTGELQKDGAAYKIIKPRIVSTLDPFGKDPDHADGVIPQPVRGGEVKQFVHGGAALSLVGAVTRDIPDSVVQDLATGKVEAITDTPGYTETTIFSPDERLGMTMTTRFSAPTDPAILGLMPRPYPAALNMGLSMFAYTYAVTGVREGRSGNVGPALIDIHTSMSEDGYRGIDLSTDNDWVFRSPMSWHPGGTKALWMEGRRGGDARRVQIVRLLDYRPGPAVAAKSTPDAMPYASTDLSVVPAYAAKADDIDVKVYGRKSGHITYRRSGGRIEKTYADFSDDGEKVYSGRETMRTNPAGRSTYTANVRLSGAKSGVMDLKVTFGPLRGDPPAALIFAPDAAGVPLTHGYVEYDGCRLEVDRLVP
jgi:hypothetical protein